MKLPSPFSLAFNQKGQTAAIFLAVFAFLLVFFLVPRKFTRSVGGDAQSNSQCIVGDAPDTNVVIKLPNIADMTLDRGVGEGGPIDDELVNFVLIRKNVPVLDTNVFFRAESDSPPNEHTFTVNSPVLPDRVLYYPGRFAHNTFHRAFTSELDNGPDKNIMLYRTEGLVVAVQKNTDGTEVINPFSTDPADTRKIRTADYYQAKEIFDKTKGYQTEELFYCAGGGSGGGNIMIPNQQKSLDNQQLQLEWFIFAKNQPSESKYIYPSCKPALYLYPPTKMQINVKVTPAGFLTYTDPQYDSKDGWTVEADPSGNLTTLGTIQANSYPYLYYESKIRDQVVKKPTQGWVVKFNELNNLYQDILPKLGLNPEQTKDFSDYWNKSLHPSPYYFVGVIDQSNVDQIEKLDITPKPDHINRVRIYFERLDQPKIVEAPLLEANSFKLQASSFNVVEWGGMVKNDPNHPFTCSQ